MDPVFLKLQEAENAFEQAFNAVLIAESANANVTSLLDQLNDAAVLLSQAENAYRAGDNNLALSNADRVIQFSRRISDPQLSRELTLENQTPLWVKTALVIIGSVIFILVMFMLWGQFKRHYTKRLNGELRAQREII